MFNATFEAGYASRLISRYVLGVPVDVVPAEGLRPAVRAEAEIEAILL
jgi:hypothetical protein